ncbi:MAG: capsule biosynthesis protein CapG [Lachnospiraceae bacterium]|nr:capsule biosynthesis protein CapG [Lachnospiraceae bacterium]
MEKSDVEKSIAEQIDFVITWVDGNDIEWQRQKNIYLHKADIDDRVVRYRDWDNLKYWFRGVEKYAAWVNKIYFATCGQLPAWLNTEHKKLVVVEHKDFIESKYLPTFNSAAIEVNMHKIKGLSDKFVYFNDDMFIISPVNKSDFFVHNKPVDRGIENIIPLKLDKDLVVNNIMRNHVMLVNRHFDKRVFIKKNWNKWFSIQNRSDVIRNILLSLWKDFCGFKTFHLPTAFLKSTFYEVELLEREMLEKTSSHKFRTGSDVSQWLFQNWQIVSGNYILPKCNYGQYFETNINNVELICKAIKKHRYKIICINDEVYDNNFERVRDAINNAFGEIFPEKSNFER